MKERFKTPRKTRDIRLDDDNEAAESRRSKTKILRRVGATATALVTSTALVLGLAADGGSHEKNQTGHEVVLPPDQARDILATHRYQDPNLLEVNDTGAPAPSELRLPDGYETIIIKMNLPDNPVAQQMMKDYAARTSAVSWGDKPGLTSYTIKEGADGKYHPAGQGFVIPQGMEVDVWDGNAEEEVFAHTPTDVLGSKVAIYVTNEATTTNNKGQFVETNGQQYVGTLELVERDGGQEWVVMPDQPQLADISDTTASTPR